MQGAAGHPSKSPCKTFEKKRSVTCYRLQLRTDPPRFHHVEMLRVVSPTPGEFYVLPIETLQKQDNTHYSYHRSGRFHWKLADGSRVVPAAGEADSRRASVLTQAVKHCTGQLDGYCIAKGRDVSDAMLTIMIQIMDGYVIPPLIAMGVATALRTKKNFSIPLLDSPHKQAVERILELAASERKILTGDEMLAKWQQALPQAKILQTDPQPQYATYSAETMIRVYQIAQQLVAEKFGERPPFWMTNSGDRGSPSTDMP